ncbi:MULTISPECIES: DUF3224 domain-containing protein [Dactylosporangium]|uniref:DUF3224 domain-containing protein n=2 Tax=Dactylosporangium TaxID=35753 RepID=A0A9W6KRG7_9ACTN|nr:MULTISPECIES: DUF3224 domain-containing protein [Dactylosporangium]UAB93892.1 DUF3224 domain-containing protein [Dactylosporangium vinaceum]UWZ42312.1 DUF3224 domain-containing protein [Dactylosporangium matsuzakiense]GLL05314.1 hypothetical protein GCM10017581_070610 [Dactylosporangium matsuzakiense]
MPSLAKSSFTIDNRDNTPVEWNGGPMTRARWTKTFTGELTGTSVVELILLGPDGDGPAIYLGVERFDCELAGRKGGFLLIHSASMLGEAHEASWTIVPGSGTGELAGLSGRGEITPEHDLILHYDLEE